MKKAKNIAKFAIKICIFAIFLLQGAKDCFSQEILSQTEHPLSHDIAFLSQREIASSHDSIAPSQDGKFFLEKDRLLSQGEEEFLKILPQEIFSRKNFDNTQICDNFIAIKNVEVFVDNIRESEIERQIQEIASAKINDFIANSNQNASELEASIVIRQRSYYKSTDRRNSIYVYYSICDKNRKLVVEDCFVTDGRASIISAATQVKQIKKAVYGMKKYLKDYDGKDGEALVAKR